MFILNGTFCFYSICTVYYDQVYCTIKKLAYSKASHVPFTPWPHHCTSSLRFTHSSKLHTSCTCKIEPDHRTYIGGIDKKSTQVRILLFTCYSHECILISVFLRVYLIMQSKKLKTNAEPSHVTKNYSRKKKFYPPPGKIKKGERRGKKRENGRVTGVFIFYKNRDAFLFPQLNEKVELH